MKISSTHIKYERSHSYISTPSIEHTWNKVNTKEIKTKNTIQEHSFIDNKNLTEEGCVLWELNCRWTPLQMLQNQPLGFPTFFLLAFA